MKPGYAAAPSVRHAEVEGLRVILDLRAERYRVLDDSASALWSVLVGERDEQEAFEAAAAEYELEEERWRADLAGFASTCESEGLLVRAGPERPREEPRAPRPPRGPSATLRALDCLLGTRRALGRDGFNATYDSYARIEVGPAAAPLEDSLAAFTRAENLFVSRRAPGDCLLRSLSLYRFLRSSGCAAEHVVGVRRFGFRAHAWVEHEGSALLDDRAPEFTPLARLGAPAAVTS